MKVSCSNGFGGRVVLEIEKSSSQVFVLSLTPLMWLWSHPKMSFPQRVWLLFGSLNPSKFGDEISGFADPGCLSRILDPSWIPDPNFFHPGSQIPIKEFKYLNPKNWVLSSQKYNLGFPPRIRNSNMDPDFLPIWILILDPHPRSRGQKGTGSLIPDPGSRSATLEISDLLWL